MHTHRKVMIAKSHMHFKRFCKRGRKCTNLLTVDIDMKIWRYAPLMCTIECKIKLEFSISCTVYVCSVYTYVFRNKYKFPAFYLTFMIMWKSMWITLSLNRLACTNHVVYHAASFLWSLAIVITNLAFLHMANVIYSLHSAPSFSFIFLFPFIKLIRSLICSSFRVYLSYPLDIANYMWQSWNAFVLSHIRNVPPWTFFFCFGMLTFCFIRFRQMILTAISKSVNFSDHILFCFVSIVINW